MTTIEQLLREADPLRQFGGGAPVPETVAAVGREIALNSMGAAEAPASHGSQASHGGSAGRKRRRRVVVAGLVASAVLGISTTSFAVRAMPGDVSDVFSYLRNDPDIHVDVDSVERVATGPGPDGARFSVVQVRGEKGTVCLSPGFETAASAAVARPTDFHRNGVFCIPKRSHASFGPGGSVAENDSDPYRTYVYEAGTAVRADLRLPDGTALPALLVEGQFCGWYPSSATGATLVGYDRHGAVVGELQIEPPA